MRVACDEAIRRWMLSGAETTTRTGDSALIDGSNTTPFDICTAVHVPKLQVDGRFFYSIRVAKYRTGLSDRAIRPAHWNPHAECDGFSSQTNAPLSCDGDAVAGCTCQSGTPA